MKHAVTILTIALIALLANGGCPKDTSFTSTSGLKLAVPPIKDTTMADSARTRPDSARMFGFAVSASGAAEIHFYDSGDRHTGPATAEEYLPVIQLALNNPNLHPQERASLEDMKARMQASGSAGEFAVTRRIPNLTYVMKGTETKAEFIGGDELVMKIIPVGVDQVRITVRSWNNKQTRQAVYNLMAGSGQSGEMNLSAMMSDFAISWDGGSGKYDREIEPAGLDSQPAGAK
jgi:hypothetical protein